MKKIILFFLAAAMFAGCSKKKCEGCTATEKIFINGDLQSQSTYQVGCAVTPGTNTKQIQLQGGKMQTIITITKCD